MKKSVKIIITVVVVVMVGAVILFPVKKNTGGDVRVVSYEPVLPVYSINVDYLEKEKSPLYVSVELFGREIYGFELKNRMAGADINLGESDIYSEENLQSAADVIINVIGGWLSVEQVYDITYCGDELSADNLDYCKMLRDKNYTQCVVFKSDFLTSDSAENEGFNSNSRYDDWMWYLAKTDDGEWELLTWGYG